MNGRFSNGETWPEQLASLMQVPHVDDFAYGGATTNNSVAQGMSGYNESIAVPDVRAQLHEYMESVHGKVDRNALYILSGGSNDVYYGTKETLNIWRLGNQCAATLKRLAQYDRSWRYNDYDSNTCGWQQGAIDDTVQQCN